MANRFERFYDKCSQLVFWISVSDIWFGLSDRGNLRSKPRMKVCQLVRNGREDQIEIAAVNVVAGAEEARTESTRCST
jgi:hypothetical protein